jgi:hypothetical protein
MSLRVLMPVSLLFAFSCNVFGKGACEKLGKAICDECNLDDFTKDAVCGCITEGEVDNADDYFENDEDAEMWCAELSNSLSPSYVTNEEVSDCRQELDMFKEYEGDACEYYGYERPGGSDGSDGSYYYSDGSDGSDGSYYYDYR